jgi:hypothetical protein
MLNELFDEQSKTWDLRIVRCPGHAHSDKEDRLTHLHLLVNPASCHNRDN